ncbi:MAG TPA: alanine--tRNA ligase, partial [Vicinamibacterales bacterium]|nr:alanine--tRNA ligase [Vicinamibacterales bacterium]
MRSAEIRASFLDYFARNGHRVVPSAPLVPADDPTLLFTNAGMNQFKDVFLGREKRDYTRAASVQKCMRVSGKHNDLEAVGPSLRHHTFFEMLGNFSFGDYFKREAIGYAWELLTEVWRLPPDRLYPTVFRGEGGVARDDEAFELWAALVPAERITELGLAENFWAMGETGPCGRCSEIHYFRGADVPCPEPVCRGLECGCDRFVEVWNNVFMEFDRRPDGTLAPLPAPSIDTGMGLERIAAVLQGKLSNYDTDLFAPLVDAIAGRAGVAYRGTTHEPSDVSIRVVADHIRATVFLIADGVVPSNEWRGYVLRKIMRRAMRHGKRLGMDGPFLYTLVDVLTGVMGDAYPELRRNRDAVVQVIRAEEERFDAVLTTGLPRLEAALDRAAEGGRILPGEEIFRLYDSLGLPLDFIEDMASQRGVALDREGFERAMAAQRDRARAGSAFEAGRPAEFQFRDEAARAAVLAAGDRFEGYTTTRLAGVPILALFDADRRQAAELHEGEEGFVVLAATPFYVEAGGQVSDTGEIRVEATGARARVEGMTRVAPGGPRAHRVRVVSGALRERDLATAEVDAELRDATRRNHTATHLLHAALRRVLGAHVKQAGSLVAPDRLRFDFVHFAPLGRAEIETIERMVNEQIVRNLPVVTEVRATEEAIAAGAMALFGEKYGDRVRVVSIPEFSLELCGGTHCRATGDIGLFVVTGESGVAAGVRRIEALTGLGALAWVQQQRAAIDAVRAATGTPLEQAP